MEIQFAHSARNSHSVYNSKDRTAVTIGRFSYVAEHCTLLTHWFSAEVAIGNFTCIAANCRFFPPQNHHPEWVANSPVEHFFGTEAGAGRHETVRTKIEIGHDVWIGDGVTFLAGVKVGDGAVIGANSVVAKDVPPYAVVVGNPGRVVRLRFPEPVIEALLAIQWWNWEIQQIKDMGHLIWSSDINAFIEAARSKDA